MMMRVFMAAALLGILGGWTSGGAQAAEHAAVMPLLADDVVAVGFVDLQQVNVEAVIDQLASLGAVPDPKTEPEAPQFIATLQGQVDMLTQLGVRRVYAVMRASDVLAGGTSWVVETAEPSQAAAALDTIKVIATQSGIFDEGSKPQAFAVRENLVLAARTEEQLKIIQERRTAKPRAEVAASLNGLADSDVGLALFGDADSRRVLREMFPQLPAPFEAINGKLLADGVQWAAVGLSLPPQPTITFSLETSSNEIATKLGQLFDDARTLAGAAVLAESVSGAPAHQQRAAAVASILPSIKLTQDGPRLSLAFGDDPQEIEFLQNVAPTLTHGLRQEGYRTRRMRQFKEIGLELLNYESARKTFPAAASYSADGKPLLSWRVQALPYSNEPGAVELWKQFKLDEPWDSEHNRKLIDQMPAIYADPDPAIRKLAGPGKTTYVVPTGEGLIFGGKEPKTYRDVTDGTSTTILAVEVPPERAVIWTKPDDWEVDLDNPLEGVKRSDRDWFTAAWCDGHVSILTDAISPETFKALLTPAGGEVVDQADIK